MKIKKFLTLMLLMSICYTIRALDRYVEIKTPSMVEFLKNWYGLEPNEKGFYSIDSLQKVYRYKVTELPLPEEFKYLKNVSDISIHLDDINNCSKGNILDLRPFPHQFNKYLAIVSLSPLKMIILGEESDLTMLVVRYNCEELDVSKCINLKKLICNNSGLKKLNLGDNINLEELDCSKNKLKYLDLSQNKNLKRLNCSSNLFARMDSLLLPKSIIDLNFMGNKFSSWPQYFYVKSYPKLEILQLNSDVTIKFK